MTIWLIIIGCGILTFLTRFLPLTGVLPARLPAWFEQAMGFVPIAVLTPIIMHAIFISGDDGLVFTGNYRIHAGLVALVIALITRSVIWTLLAGFSCLWALNFYLT